MLLLVFTGKYLDILGPPCTNAMSIIYIYIYIISCNNMCHKGYLAEKADELS